jgi:hypothetical protein
MKWISILVGGDNTLKAERAFAIGVNYDVVGSNTPLAAMRDGAGV